MKHVASPQFWKYYANLPIAIQHLADKNYALLKENPHHPSLHFKQIGRFWSVRIGLGYRALAVETPSGFVWFWIGSHPDYDRLLVRN